MATFGATNGTITVQSGCGLSGGFSTKVGYVMEALNNTDNTGAVLVPFGWATRDVTTLSHTTGAGPNSNGENGGYLGCATGSSAGDQAGIISTNQFLGNSGNPIIEAMISIPNYSGSIIRFALRANTGLGWTSAENYIMIYFDDNVDSFFFLETCNGSTVTTSSFDGTGGPGGPGNNTLYTMRIEQTGTSSVVGSVIGRIDGVLEETDVGAVSISSNIPTTTEWYAVIEVETLTAASRSIDILSFVSIQDE